jgi:hypothetical protein
MRRYILAALGIVACSQTSTTSDVAQGRQPGSGQPWCIAGQSIACGGPGSCVGYQICADDGSGYLPCKCDSPAAPPPAKPNSLDPAIDEWEARCHAPDGPAVTFGSAADVPAQLTGKWWSCGGQPPYTTSIEFTEDGHYYQLTFADGGLQRNSGGDTSGTYEITDAGGIHFELQHTTQDKTCCTGQPDEGDMQTTPPGKMMLNGFIGGNYLRVP